MNLPNSVGIFIDTHIVVYSCYENNFGERNCLFNSSLTTNYYIKKIQFLEVFQLPQSGEYSLHN